MYTSTSYQPMRTGVVIPRQVEGKPREAGSVPRQRPARGNDRRRAIAESVGVR